MEILISEEIVRVQRVTRTAIKYGETDQKTNQLFFISSDVRIAVRASGQLEWCYAAEALVDGGDKE